MKINIRSYFWGLLAWEVFVLTPILITFFRAGRQIRGSDIPLLAAVIVFGVFVAAASSATGPKVGPILSLVLGFLIGSVSALLAGLVWASATRGFEAPAAVFIGCLLLSIPSGLGSAVATWINQRLSVQPH